jgi:hypothetical protein
MPADVGSLGDADLNGVFQQALSVNPFLDNRVDGPVKDSADVARIHQAAFEQLTALAGQALAGRRGIGAMLWGEAGIGKSHLLARLASWSEQHATFVYLHNLQAAPHHLPRSLLRAVVSTLTGGRASGFYRTTLTTLVNAGLFEAVGRKDGTYPWPYLRRAWDAFVNRLAGEHPGLASVDRNVYEVLIRFFYSAYRVYHPPPDFRRRDDGSLARRAVQWLSGLGLEPDEGRSLGLPPAVPRDEPVALADAQQIKHVLVALARLAAARRTPFILAFDQVDNLDVDQASALGRFLEALIDSAPNLLVVTAGVRATLFRWRQDKVFQDSTWDRLAQLEVELQRVGGVEAGDLIRARLDEFFRPYENLGGLRQRRQHDDFFPLGRAWYERQFKDKIDLRPRDVINQAREAWHGEQQRLRQAGVGPWLGDKPGPAIKETLVAGRDDEELSPNALDQMLDEKIAQLCPPQPVPPPAGNAEDLAELLRKVLIQCRKADPGYGVVEVERAPLSKKQKHPLYDLSVFLRAKPDTASLRVGVLVLSSTSATQVAAQLRRLTRELPAIDRLVLITQEWSGVPIGHMGKVYLSKLQGHFGDRFQQLELTPTEYLHLDSLRTTAQLAQAGDLEIETASGRVRAVTEDQVIASHHRRDRYRSSRVLRKLLGTPTAAENLAGTATAGKG